MAGLLPHLGSLFEKLSDLTSTETVEERPYANTRTGDSLYSITNTQSANSTYAAGEATAAEDATETSQRGRTEPFDCEDPVTCPTCTPTEVNTS